MPFKVPSKIPADLARVEAYWRSLLRGGAEIPFSDDLDLQSLSDMRSDVLLLEVFAVPLRFRLDIVGEHVEAPAQQSLAGRFTDEIKPTTPLEFLQSQACATLESGVPTLYDAGGNETSGQRGYARLLLPMWGDGHINMILGAVEWG